MHLGYAISFPGSIHNSFVTYKVSDQMIERLNEPEIIEEDDDHED